MILFRSFKTVLIALWCFQAYASIGGEPAPAFGLKGQASPRQVYVYDARPLNSLDLKNPGNVRRVWDTLHVLAALQGLANRDHAQFYLLYCSGFGVETDAFWLDWFQQEDGWLKASQIRKLSSVEEVLGTMRGSFQGLAVYDENAPATANLASTAAGCDDLLPVRYDPQPDSLYSLLTERLRLPVKLWLINPDGTSKFTGKGMIPDLNEPSTGSAKADAYLWALRKYLARCAPGIAAYYLDAYWLKTADHGPADMHTLSNHDYFIARKAFFFDVSPWGDERPNDDLEQPLGLDRKVFLRVMAALYDHAHGGMIKVGGFPPWPYKYTSHASKACKYDGVPTEWEFGRLISQYNGYMEADAAGLAAMANASFYRHYPLAARYPQPNPKPDAAIWKARGFVTEGKVAARFYVGHYVGDYDAPSWVYKAVPAYFRDPARGRTPMGWALDPNLADRCPQALAYAYKNATTNDYFIAGDSGAGYLNARGLTIRPESKLPSGLEAWVAHCTRYFRQWDMSITGFLLDGSAGAATEVEFAAYRAFSPDGIGTHFEKGPALHAGVPTCPEQDLPDKVEEAAKVITQLAQQSQGKPGFLWARSILKPPKWYADLSRELKDRHSGLPIEIVDPYTFFGLIRKYKE